MKSEEIKELEKKIIGLTDQLAYYKHAYNSKCKQVDDLLFFIKELEDKQKELKSWQAIVFIYTQKN